MVIIVFAYYRTDLLAVASLGGGAGGVARPGCHRFGVTPFYDESRLKLLLNMFEDVVASVNVSFMR